MHLVGLPRQLEKQSEEKHQQNDVDRHQPHVEGFVPPDTRLVAGQAIEQ